MLMRLLMGGQGVYVLSDNAFGPLTRMSMAVRSEAVARAEAVRSFCPLLALAMVY